MFKICKTIAKTQTSVSTPTNHCRSSGFFASAYSWRDSLVFALICAVLQPWHQYLALPSESSNLLQFHFSHWVHLNWLHWFLNMATLFCLPFLLPTIPRLYVWFQTLFFPTLLSFFLLSFNSLEQANVSSYVGFSGVLHGIYFFCAAYFLLDLWFSKKHKLYSQSDIGKLPRYFRWQAGLISCAILIKITYEHYYHPTHTGDILQARVLYTAHSLGVLLAIAFFFAYLIKKWHKSSRKKNHGHLP